MSEQAANSGIPCSGENQTRRLIFPVLALLVFAFVAGLWFSSGQENSGQTLQIEQMRKQQRALNDKIAEAEALLSLRNIQIDSMQQQLEKEAVQKTAMQQRLDMFENILASRKIRGVHIQQPAAYWQDAHLIAYDFILVKGRNYPRKANGSISFAVARPQHKTITLQDEHGESGLAYEFVTHAFIQGSLVWKQDWQPEQLTISLFNKRGKTISQTTIPILKESGRQ